MYSLMTHDRICQHCGKEFVSQKKSTKYCSHRCANLADKARKKAQKQLLKQENAKEARRQDLLQKNFLSITEAAKLLQISRNTIYILIKKHDIPLQRLTARTVRIAQDELYKIRHEVKSPINSTPQELAERDASLITREEVTKTYGISTAWFFSQLKKHGIKAQRIAGGCFYNKDDMERIFSHKEFLHITEWYTFQELKEMTGFRTESICDIIKTNKIPKKKTNNCVYVSKKHWDEARGNHLNLEEEYYTMKQISAKYGLSCNYLYCFLRDQGIERIKIGNFAYFKKETIDQVLTNRNNRK